MIEQHNLLGRVAALIDEGVLKTTLSKVVPELTPLTLARGSCRAGSGSHGGQAGDRHERFPSLRRSPSGPYRPAYSLLGK